MTSVERDPQLRVCVGCGEERYSAAHCSPRTAFCGDCGMPLLKTLTTALAEARAIAARRSPRPRTRA